MNGIAVCRRTFRFRAFLIIKGQQSLHIHQASDARFVSRSSVSAQRRAVGDEQTLAELYRSYR